MVNNDMSVFHTLQTNDWLAQIRLFRRRRKRISIDRTMIHLSQRWEKQPLEMHDGIQPRP